MISTSIFQQFPFSECVKKILLGLGASETERELQLQSAIEEASTDQIHQSLPSVWDIFNTHRETHGSLCLSYFEEVLYSHPNALAVFLKPEYVSDLFRGEVSDLRAGVLLWRLLRYKHSALKDTCEVEVRKLVKALERRHETKDLRKIPPCCLRYTLLKIISDIPPSREVFRLGYTSEKKAQGAGAGGIGVFPGEKKFQGTAEAQLLDYCFHWLASQDEPVSYKVPILELLRSVTKSTAASLVTSHILSLFFYVLTTKKNVSDDLQFVLALMDWGELPSLLPAVFEGMTDEKLASIWTYLCLLEPVPLPEVLAINSTWSFFYEVFHDPLTRFQKILVKQFFVNRGKTLGNTALTILLNLVKDELNAARALSLYRELKSAECASGNFYFPTKMGGYFTKLRDKYKSELEDFEAKYLDHSNFSGGRKSIKIDEITDEMDEEMIEEERERKLEIIELLDLVLHEDRTGTTVNLQPGQLFRNIQTGNVELPSFSSENPLRRSEMKMKMNAHLDEFDKMCRGFMEKTENSTDSKDSPIKTDVEKQNVENLMRQMRQHYVDTLGKQLEQASKQDVGLLNPHSSLRFNQEQHRLEEVGGSSSSTTAAGKPNVKPNIKKLLRQCAGSRVLSENQLYQLYLAGTIGTGSYIPRRTPSIVEESFQLVPNADKHTFMRQKKIEENLIEKGLIDRGYAASQGLGGIGGGFGKNLNTLGTPDAGAQNDRGLWGLFRQNIEMHQNLTLQQLELAQQNLREWTALETKIQKEYSPILPPPTRGRPASAQTPASLAAKQLTVQFKEPTAYADGRPGQLVAESKDVSGIQISHPRTGIRNTNNTCFINTTLQTLYHTDAFLQNLFQFKLKEPSANAGVVEKEDYEIGTDIVRQLQLLFGMLLVTERPHLELEAFISALPPSQFPSGEQQDAAQFFGYMLDKLGGSKQGLIRSNFAGELNYVTKCESCGHEKRNPETFTEIILPVPEKPMQHIQQLLSEKLERQKMTDTVSCSACGKPGNPTVWSEIMSPPKHLQVVLVRFDFKAGGLIKLKTLIQIDEEIRIDKYIYSLYMILIHTGATADSGHYTCLGRRSEAPQSDRRVWKFDDSQVTLYSNTGFGNVGIEKPDDTPYMLFYRCTQAPTTKNPTLPNRYIEYLRQEDAKEKANMS